MLVEFEIAVITICVLFFTTQYIYKYYPYKILNN